MAKIKKMLEGVITRYLERAENGAYGVNRNTGQRYVRDARAREAERNEQNDNAGAAINEQLGKNKGDGKGDAKGLAKGKNKGKKGKGKEKGKKGGVIDGNTFP